MNTNKFVFKPNALYLKLFFLDKQGACQIKIPSKYIF